MELVSVQYLRAVAAIAVVVFHVELQLARMGYDGPWPVWLSSGVDVFFVISGFIMMVTTHGRSVSPLQFYRRRIVRIVPLYWLLTSLIVCVQLVSPALLQSSRFELDHVIASYLFVPSLHPVLGTMEPVLVPGWTLNYEMFFYLIFGGTLLLPERHRMPTLLLVLAALALVGAGYPDTRSVIGFYTSNIVLEFGFGVVIAHLFLRGVRVPGAIAGMVLVAGVAGLAMSSADTLPRVIKWGLPAAMIVIGAIGIETSRGVARMRLPHFLGDASYSIYLSHGIVLSAFGQAWRKLGLAGTGHVVFTIFATVAACAVGGLLYVLLERPLLKLMQRRPLQRLVAPTSAS